MTVIQAMLGNMTRESGKVSYSGKLAFIPQEAWIRNGSVRDNVIFSLPYDKEKYKKVLSMTGLDSDIKQLKNGSKTLIGEKGIRHRFQDHYNFRSMLRFCWSNEFYWSECLNLRLDISVRKSLATICFTYWSKNVPVLIAFICAYVSWNYGHNLWMHLMGRSSLM